MKGNSPIILQHPSLHLRFVISGMRFISGMNIWSISVKLCPKTLAIDLMRAWSLEGRKVEFSFSRNRDDLISPKLIPGTDIYVYTCFGREGTMRTVKKHAGFFGVEEPVKE